MDSHDKQTRTNIPMLVLSVAIICIGGTYALMQFLQPDQATASQVAVPPASTAASPAPPAAAPAVSADVPRQEDPALSPVVREQLVRARMTELETKLMEDPVSPEWANHIRSRVDSIVGNPEFFSPDIAKVMTHETLCRTNGCRISFRFPAGIDGDEELTKLRLELGDEFARTAIVPIWNADGSSEHHIYFAAEGADHLIDRPRSSPGTEGQPTSRTN
jgi:hypothetical protein